MYITSWVKTAPATQWARGFPSKDNNRRQRDWAEAAEQDERASPKLRPTFPFDAELYPGKRDATAEDEI